MRTLKSRQGVTIGEMLVALLIMVFLTLTVAGGAGVAMKVYRTQTLYSESRVLANSVLVAITEELRYASGAVPAAAGGSVTYNSRIYGAGVTMEIEEWSPDSGGGRLRIHYDKEEGEDRGKTDYPYSDKTYTGLHIEAMEGKEIFRSGDTPHSIIISYNICDSRGKAWASVEDLKLRFLNGEEE